MARIRTIKPSFFRHIELYEIEKKSKLPIRIAFAGLWTAADREGRFKWKPKELKLDALPHDDVDFSRVLDVLVTGGYLVRYMVEGVLYGVIPSWNLHQSINNRESESVLPPPPQEALSMRVLTGDARVNHTSGTPLEQDQGEGKGREGDIDVSGAYPKPDDIDETIWSAFVLHRKAKKAAITELVMDGIRRETQTAGWTVNDALRETIERNWQSFKAEWVTGKTGSASRVNQGHQLI